MAMDPDVKLIVKFIGGIVLALAVVTVLGMAGCPVYNVWQQKLKGEAELARAEQNRKIKIQEARATEESAKAYANAEVTRARGVAKANQIIGDSLRNNESYLRYLWVMGLNTNQTQVVYVPTEANLPILEANRLNKPAASK